ncbi:MAG: metallophosphoesterase [Proteobacteria bacterium]|nr:metallophosphoesterase [Pseudomonadota bacterium]
MPKVRAAIVTDVHYGIDSGCKLGSKAPRLMKKFIRAVGAGAPDFILDMGDRISHRNQRDDAKRMKALKSHFNEIFIPLYCLVGNHDIKNLSREENERIMGSPGASYSRNINGYHFIFWNPNVNNGDTGLKLDPDDLQWLKDDLSKCRGPAILFSHVPLDNDTDDNIKAYASSAAATGIITNRFYYDNASDIRETLEKSGKIILCMAGHRHINRYREINGIHYITQQSLTNQYKEKYRIPAGTWSMLEIDDGGITVTLHGKTRLKMGGKLRRVYELNPRATEESEQPPPGGPLP